MKLTNTRQKWLEVKDKSLHILLTSLVLTSQKYPGGMYSDFMLAIPFIQLLETSKNFKNELVTTTGIAKISRYKWKRYHD